MKLVVGSKTPNVKLKSLSTEGWVSGYFQAPSYRLLVQELNRGEAFLRLTQATLPGKMGSYDSLAPHRNSIILIVPENDLRAEQRASSSWSAAFCSSVPRVASWSEGGAMLESWFMRATSWE